LLLEKPIGVTANTIIALRDIRAAALQVVLFTAVAGMAKVLPVILEVITQAVHPQVVVVALDLLLDLLYKVLAVLVFVHKVIMLALWDILLHRQAVVVAQN
jgi:hypothetical protein